MKQKAGAAAPSSLCREGRRRNLCRRAAGRRPSAKVKAAAQRFVLSSFVSCYGEQNACVPRLVGPEVGQRPFVKKQLLLGAFLKKIITTAIKENICLDNTQIFQKVRNKTCAIFHYYVLYCSPLLLLCDGEIPYPTAFYFFPKSRIDFFDHELRRVGPKSLYVVVVVVVGFSWTNDFIA